VRSYGLDESGLIQVLVGGSCDHGNEFTGSKKGGDIFTV
jgi:hypothetical protein